MTPGPGVPLGPAPDVGDAGVIVSGTMGFCGGIPRERPPWAIVDPEPSTALGFVGRRRHTLTPPGPGRARCMVRTRATGRDGACNSDG